EQEQEQESDSRISELEAELEERQRKIDAYVDRIQHLQADFENYKKRNRRDQQRFAEQLESRILLEILPIYDNLERAFRSYNHNEDKDSFVEGMERIFSQFSDFLTRKGVRPIETVGNRFDPAKHEALMTVETDQYEPNTVLEEFERGYYRSDMVLRPSRVKVSKRPVEVQNSKDEDEDGGEP
ncbi:MAG: nucleotide exchange factor GrpE, partial [Candidatus Bipolaricaulia bacterium]